MKTSLRARLIAFYLPQFHPIPENDEWWGPGFTEWTNVARARKLYPGHYQPRVPADLGFYDLRLPDVREAQAEMARGHGISGFCYWHYWFGGRRLLERPFAEVLQSRKPDFPFCLGWANESWSGVWHGVPERILLRQTYPGPRDEEEHFRAVLPAFEDDRYMQVDGCPIFVLYRPELIPELDRFTGSWREKAVRAGLSGIYFIGINSLGTLACPRELDAVIPYSPQFARLNLYRIVPPGLRELVRNGIIGFRARVLDRGESPELPNVPANLWPQVFSYREFVEEAFAGAVFDDRAMPVVVPGWDNTPRCGIKGLVLHNATPELFAEHVRQAVALVASREPGRRIVFVRSWNEWAEGNHLEPDLRFGDAFLKSLKSQVVGESP